MAEDKLRSGSMPVMIALLLAICGCQGLPRTTTTTTTTPPPAGIDS